MPCSGRMPMPQPARAQPWAGRRPSKPRRQPRRRSAPRSPCRSRRLHLHRSRQPCRRATARPRAVEGPLIRRRAWMISWRRRASACAGVMRRVARKACRRLTTPLLRPSPLRRLRPATPRPKSTARPTRHRPPCARTADAGRRTPQIGASLRCARSRPSGRALPNRPSRGIRHPSHRPCPNTLRRCSGHRPHQHRRIRAPRILLRRRVRHRRRGRRCTRIDRFRPTAAHVRRRHRGYRRRR